MFRRTREGQGFLEYDSFNLYMGSSLDFELTTVSLPDGDRRRWGTVSVSRGAFPIWNEHYLLLFIENRFTVARIP